MSGIDVQKGQDDRIENSEAAQPGPSIEDLEAVFAKRKVVTPEKAKQSATDATALAAVQERLGIVPPQADGQLHDAHVAEYGEEKVKEAMKNPNTNLEMARKIGALKESYTKTLFNILSESPEIARMMKQISPSDRKGYRAPFGFSFGNYDTREGEEMLKGIIDGNKENRNRPRLIEKRERISKLREGFLDAVMKLGNDSKLN